MSRSRWHSGRLSAWLALAAAVAVVAALVILVTHELDGVLAAFASIAAAGGAGWIALTRRGVVRVVAAVCAVAFLVGGVVAVIVLGATRELIALAVASILFAGLTRLALRAARPPKHATQQSRAVAPVSPARTAVLLMNPKSGGGKVERFNLVEEARRRRVETVLLSPGDDLQALAREAIATADVIGMAGGDGSQALVAQIAMENDVPYVCVPAGTRNHFAFDLGLDRNDVVASLDGFTDGVERRIDLAFVNDRIFVNNVSLGVYGEIVQSEAYRDAKVRTVEQMLPDLLGPRSTPFDLRFHGPDGREHRSAQLILVSNNPYVLDRLGAVGSRPRIDTGNLGIVTIEIGGTIQAMELVSLEALGQVRRFDGWHSWSAPEFVVESNASVATGIDGEGIVLDPPLRFRIAPGALRVRVPSSVSEVSPGELRPGLTRSGLRELWRVAKAGR
jgi:diacylglycerol kinase family enzyme